MTSTAGTRQTSTPKRAGAIQPPVGTGPEHPTDTHPTDRRRRPPASAAQQTAPPRWPGPAPAAAYTTTWTSGTSSASGPYTSRLRARARPGTRPEPAARGQRRVRRVRPDPARPAARPAPPPGRPPSTGPPRSAPAATAPARSPVRPAPAAAPADGASPVRTPSAPPGRPPPTGPAHRRRSTRCGVPRRTGAPPPRTPPRRWRLRARRRRGVAVRRGRPLPTRPGHVAFELTPTPPAPTAGSPGLVGERHENRAPLVRTVPEHRPAGARHATPPAGRRPRCSCAAGTSSTATAASLPTSPSGSSSAANGGTVRHQPSRCRPAGGPSRSSARSRSAGSSRGAGTSSPNTTRYVGRSLVRVRQQRRQRRPGWHRMPVGQLGGSAPASWPRPRVRSGQQEPGSARRVVAPRCSGPPSPAARPPPGPAPARPGCARPTAPAAPRQSCGATSTARPSRAAGPCACPASAARCRGSLRSSGRAYPANTTGGPDAAGRAAHSSCRSRSTTSGSSVRIGMADQPLVTPGRAPRATEPAGRVHHRAAHRQPRSRVVCRLQHRRCRPAAPPAPETARAPNPGARHPRGHSTPARPRRPGPGGRRTPGRSGPARPAGPATSAASRSRSAKQQREIVDHTHDPGQRPMLAQLREALPAGPPTRLRPTAAPRPSTGRAGPGRTPGRRPSRPPAPAESRNGPARSAGTPRRTRRPRDPPGRERARPGRTGRPARAARWSGTPTARPRTGHSPASAGSAR